MSDQVCLLVRRKLVLIGIATIIICATLYTIVKWRSDDSAEAAEAALVARGATGAPEISVQSSELWLTTPYFKIFCVLSSVVVLLACATSASVILDGKKAVEAERVLRELCRNTKSDASLAIPVAPIARIRINPFDIVKSCLLARRRCPDVGQDSDWASTSTGSLRWDAAPRTTTCSGASSRSRSRPSGRARWRARRSACRAAPRAACARTHPTSSACVPSAPSRSAGARGARHRSPRLSVPGKCSHPCSPSHVPAPSMHPRTLQPPQVPRSTALLPPSLDQGEIILILVFLPLLVLVALVFLLVRGRDGPRPSIDVYIKPKGVAEEDLHMRV